MTAGAPAFRPRQIEYSTMCAEQCRRDRKARERRLYVW
jgi:hypothetical protein